MPTDAEKGQVDAVHSAIIEAGGNSGTSFAIAAAFAGVAEILLDILDEIRESNKSK